jgi:hypothetical protein
MSVTSKKFLFFGGGMNGTQLQIEVVDGVAPWKVAFDTPAGKLTYHRQEISWREVGANLTMSVYVLSGTEIDPAFVQKVWSKIQEGKS